MSVQCRLLGASTAVMAALVIFPSSALAMRFPRDPQDLFAEAGLVVVGRITGIRIQTERSQGTSGFGNYDWGVYCSLLVTGIDKGAGVSEGSTIVVRCHRPKFLKSFDCFACGYHFPIPEVGQSVRVYLHQTGQGYAALDPNGFTPAGSEPLVQAAAVQRLPHGRYTYLLPIEFWIVMVVPAIFMWALAAGIRRIIACFRQTPSVPVVRRTSFSMAWLLTMIAAVAVGLAGVRWSPTFVGWMAVAAIAMLILFTLRKPTTDLGGSLWWGVNLTFASSLVAAVATEML